MTLIKHCFSPGNLCQLTFFFVMLSLASCKKNSEETPGKEFPTLGTCKPMTPSNGLTFDGATRTLTYKTSGGGIIEIDDWKTFKIRHEDYEGFEITLWGGPVINGEAVYSAVHENLNGKHIKDRQGPRRTIIFPYGTKFTLVTDDETAVILEVSIYDGDAVHHINPVCNTLELSTTEKGYAAHFDNLQADGEASVFEFTDTGLIWMNIYREDENGSKTEKREMLGELIRDDPNVVNDYFD